MKSQVATEAEGERRDHSKQAGLHRGGSTEQGLSKTAIGKRERRSKKVGKEANKQIPWHPRSQRVGRKPLPYSVWLLVSFPNLGPVPHILATRPSYLNSR